MYLNINRRLRGAAAADAADLVLRGIAKKTTDDAELRIFSHAIVVVNNRK